MTEKNFTPGKVELNTFWDMRSSFSRNPTHTFNKRIIKLGWNISIFSKFYCKCTSKSCQGFVRIGCTRTHVLQSSGRTGNIAIEKLKELIIYLKSIDIENLKSKKPFPHLGYGISRHKARLM